jgi:hypothetical protein
MGTTRTGERRRKVKVFFRGVCAGAAGMLALVLAVLAFQFFRGRDRKIYELMEKEYELQMLREEYGNRDPYEFLDEVPGVRGSADHAADEFIRKRDEAVQRIRGGHADRGSDYGGGGGD